MEEDLLSQEEIFPGEGRWLPLALANMACISFSMRRVLAWYFEHTNNPARALTKDTRERFYICIQIVFVIMQVVIKP